MSDALSNVAPISTPSRVRSYESARGDGAPRQFDIDGERFSCLPKCPGKVYMDVAYRLEAAVGDDGKTAAVGLGLMRRLFDAVLLRNDAGEDYSESSRARFDALLDSQDRIVEMDLLGDIFRDLMEDYANRPTQPPSPSPG